MNKIDYDKQQPQITTIQPRLIVVEKHPKLTREERLRILFASRILRQAAKYQSEVK